MLEIKPKTPQSIIQKDNVRPFKTPAQRRQLRTLIGVIVLIIVIAVGAYIWIIPKKKVYQLNDYQTTVVRKTDMIQTTQASGAVALPVQMSVLCPESGFAEKLYVMNGENVVQGQLLATMSAPDLVNELDDLRTTYDDSKRNLVKIETQNRYTIQKMERELAALDTQVKDAETEVNKLEDLVKINASRKSELDTKQKALTDLISKRSESQISLDEEKEMEGLDMEIRKATITQTQTKISRLGERITALAVKAPISGDILNMEKALAVPGSPVSANTVLFTIADPTSAQVELEVLEDYAGVLTLGQEITLTVGGQEVKGKIISIGKVATASSDGLGATVQVTIKPVTEGGSLLLGSTAVGTIELGKKENVLLLPRGPYLTTGNQKYLYKVQGNTATRSEVTFGVIQGNDVEIVNGVTEGDKIVTSGYENFINYEEIQLK